MEIHVELRFSRIRWAWLNWICKVQEPWWASPVNQMIKNLPVNVGDMGVIPGLERSPGGGHGNPLQNSCLENPVDRGVGGLQSTGLQSRTQLSNWHSVQLLSHVWRFATPWTAARQGSLSTTNPQSLFKLMFLESVMPSNHLILCCPLLFQHSIFPSIRVFSNESVLCISWPKYWSFNFSICPSNEHSGFISFMIDWLDLLAVQGTLKSLLQHHSSKASILWRSAFFRVQLSHPYMTTGKIIALTRWTFIGKEMSLLFNMLSRLVIAFLPKSKRLLISWLQSPSAVI